MKSNSHRTLGQYLLANYMQEYSGICKKAFSLIPSQENDMVYCVRMCSQVLQLLLQNKRLART